MLSILKFFNYRSLQLYFGKAIWNVRIICTLLESFVLSDGGICFM